MREWEAMEKALGLKYRSSPNIEKELEFQHWWSKGPVPDEDGKDMAHPLYGKKHTAASRKRQSKSAYKRFETEDIWNKGIPWSDETKEKMRESTLGMYDGEDNPNWKGGISGKPGSAKRKAYMKIYNKKYHEARRAA
jgi:hypothetical protein